MVLTDFNTYMGELYLELGMYLFLYFILVNVSSMYPFLSPLFFH